MLTKTTIIPSPEASSPPAPRSPSLPPTAQLPAMPASGPGDASGPAPERGEEERKVSSRLCWGCWALDRAAPSSHGPVGKTYPPVLVVSTLRLAEVKSWWLGSGPSLQPPWCVSRASDPRRVRLLGLALQGLHIWLPFWIGLLLAVCPQVSHFTWVSCLCFPRGVSSFGEAKDKFRGLCRWEAS